MTRLFSIFKDSLLRPQMLLRSGDETMKNRVREMAKKIAVHHRPANPRELPAYIKSQSAAVSVEFPNKAAEQAVIAEVGAETRALPVEEDMPSLCCEYKDCDRRLSEAAVQYCRSNAAWFGGKLYCMQHQKIITAARKKRRAGS